MTVHRWTFSTVGHMMLSNYLFIILAVIMFIYDKGLAFQPEFAEPITNLTVPLGRDATFKCLVLHLGGYRVGWVKADTKAIQAIHEHVITHNPRVGVSHEDHATWNLHIRNVQEEDRGQYMCQINTDPMKSQVGYLDVVIPPDFVPDETSGDVMLPEGGGVRLACRARGHPQPRVIWRREDGQDIILKDPMGVKNRVSSFQGEMLKLAKVARSEMGAYLCIASNGVPPSVSKRIMLNVHFHPVIQVPNQLVGAPLGTDVKLECHVEASPKSINYWIRDTGDMIVSSNKHDVQTSSRSLFEVKMTLIIRGMQPDDVGSYKCVAKNSLGEVDSYIRLYDIPGPTRKSFQPRFDEEDYPDQYGSAEREIDEENTNRVGERDKTRTSTTPVHQINNGRINNHNNNNNYQNNHQNHWGTSTSSITPFVNKVHRIVSNDGGGSKTTTTHHYDNRIPVLPTSKIPQTFSSNSATTLKSLRFSLLVLSVLCCSVWFRERFKI